jgi:hypothetical protein
MGTPRAGVVDVIEGQRCRGGSLTVEPLATGDRLNLLEAR